MRVLLVHLVDRQRSVLVRFDDGLVEVFEAVPAAVPPCSIELRSHVWARILLGQVSLEEAHAAGEVDFCGAVDDLVAACRAFGRT